MPIDKATALAQIDAVLERRKQLIGTKDNSECQELITLECAVIDRLAPPGSVYIDHRKAALTMPTMPSVDGILVGVIQALRADYAAGRLQTFQEMLRADLFSDFLEMAEYFLEEGFKDPAAVVAGGVLEQHLRKLCAKHGVALPARPKLELMNADLAKANTYGKNEQKSVTAWAGIRNDAAHGDYAKYSAEQVKLMVMGIREFVSRFSA